MKQLLFSFLLLALSANLYAQDPHLEFKGISLDGNLSTFVQKLEQDGFTLKENIYGYISVMKGIFAGKESTLLVAGTPNSKTVWKVVVDFEKTESWNTLKSDYYKMKELFTKKYGEPDNSYEFFSKPYYEGDGYELQALQKEKCYYVSFYSCNYGTVSVVMSENGNIQVNYEDAANVKIKKAEDEAIIFDDI